jgi:F-type H+-transporting ATPase subunit b
MSRKLILFLGLFAVAGLVAGPAYRPARAAEPAESKAAATDNHDAHASSGAAHDESGEDPKILKEELDLAFWTFVVFLLLLLVLKKYAWGPLIKSMQAREEHIEHCLVSAEQARNESEQLLNQHRKQMADTADEVRGIIDEARRNAQALQDDILAKARNEAEAEKERAKHEIASARDQALSEIWNKAAELAVSVAGKVLEKEISEGDHRRLIDSAIQELPARPVGTNGHGGHHA